MPIRAQLRAGVRARARARALALAAITAALAAPAVAQGAANPMTFDYSNSTAISGYARPTGAVVVGRNFQNPALVDQIQNGGGEVYQYVNVIDSWWSQWTATGEQAALYGGAQTNPGYLMSPRRSNWPGTYMMDMRPGSPWILHAVDHLKQWFPTTHSKGIFLDVVGERLWTGSWDAMSAQQKADWTAGNRDFVHRLRVALGPSVIIVANNLWANGNPDLNGITIEHHGFSEARSWAPQLGRSDWFKPVRNMVIANSASEARSWGGIAGVTHVTPQAAYEQPVAPLLSFSLLPGVAPNQDAHTPAPPPVVTPAPAPSLTLPGPASPKKRTPAVAPKPAPTPSPSPIIPGGNLLKNPSLERAAAGWTTWRGDLAVDEVADAPDGGHAARVRFGGVGTAYSLSRGSGIRVAQAGVGLRAQVYVRAGSASATGKPVSLYLRERTPAGRLVRRVHATVRLGAQFAPVTATLAPRSRRNRVDLILVQRRAQRGDAFLADALSVTLGG